MVLPASVICEPTALSFLRSGFSYLSSFQNYLCSLAERIMLYSRRETWLSKRMVYTRSVQFYSRSSRFSRMIFLKRQMLNCSWKAGQSLKAAENYSYAFYLLCSCSSWNSAKLMRSLVQSGNFLMPALNIRSTCFSSCAQLQSMLSSVFFFFFFFSVFSGQSASLQISLCFSMYPMSSIQLFLSSFWLQMSCSTQEMCASSSSPDLNLMLLVWRVLVSEAPSKQMMMPKKGSPQAQMASAPVNSQLERSWPTRSMSAVQKQQVEQILQNLVVVLEQQGSLTVQHQNCQNASRNMIITQKVGPLKGLKLNRNCSTILFRMNTTYPFEFCRAVSFLEVIRGSNSATATTVDIITNSAMNSSAMEAWKRCQPCQQATAGKLAMQSTPSWVWHSTTLSMISVMGRKRTVTKRGTICARMIRGKVNWNFFLLKEQLTYIMSKMISRMMKIRPQSIVRKAAKGALGRQLENLKVPKNMLIQVKVLPPFQAYRTIYWKGNAKICRQSRPDQMMMPQIDYYYSYYAFLSMITNSTLKMESLKSDHACRMVFFYSRPISVLELSSYYMFAYFAENLNIIIRLLGHLILYQLMQSQISLFACREIRDFVGCGTFGVMSERLVISRFFGWGQLGI